RSYSRNTGRISLERLTSKPRERRASPSVRSWSALRNEWRRQTATACGSRTRTASTPSSADRSARRTTPPTPTRRAASPTLGHAHPPAVVGHQVGERPPDVDTQPHRRHPRALTWPGNPRSAPLQVPVEPLQHDLEPTDPMPRVPGTGELVAFGGEADQLHLA